MIIAHFDGGCVAPGIAGYGFTIKRGAREWNGAKIFDESNEMTVNIAEYTGLITVLKAIKWLQEKGDLPTDEPVEIYGDSKMVINMVSGKWGNHRKGAHRKNPHLIPYLRLAVSFLPQHAQLIWIPREQNKKADALYNKALKKYRKWREDNPSPREQKFWDSLPDVK